MCWTGPGISAVLSGAATAGEIETNVREARTRIPDEVWNEALARVAELDAGYADFPEFVAMANWVERVIGDRIRLRKLRWNTDVPGWQVEGIVSLSSGERLDVQVPKGTAYEMPGRELWISDHGEHLSFRRGAWSHVMHAQAPGVHWYCNVTTPAEYRGGALTWTDLGIDVEVYPGGEVALDDLPEFREVREALPKAEFEQAARAARGLLADGAAERAPFDRLRANGGARAAACVEQKLFWLAPGLGDGLAAVGEAAQARRPEVVERVLDTGSPSALTGLGAGALMGLAETAAPRDGVTVLVAETELAAGLESVRFGLQVWGPGLHVRLVLVRDEPEDVRREFEAALRRPERSATIRLAGALAKGLPKPHGFLTTSGFVAAVWR